MCALDDIRELLTPLSPELVELKDDSLRHAGHASAGGGGHFELKIVSQAFTGQSLVSRHRKIYALLSSLIPGKIHALSISALSPEECTALPLP